MILKIFILFIAMLVASCTADVDPSASFLLEGVTKVIVRASLAKEAKVTMTPGEKSLLITGTPSGGAPGYHPANGKKEVPAKKWGLKFVGKRFGPILVISSQNETRYIEQHYYLSKIEVMVPKEIPVSLELRELSGDGAPDLSAPK